MVLRPNVRYELTNKTRLIFADVETEYFFEEESTVSFHWLMKRASAEDYFASSIRMSLKQGYCEGILLRQGLIFDSKRRLTISHKPCAVCRNALPDHAVE